MTRRFFPLLALAALLALGACAGTRPDMLRLYQHDSGDMIRLDVGETMQVVLDGNPATDVHWLRDEETEAIITQVGETQYERDPRTYDTRRRLQLNFRAKAEGRTRLQLQYSSLDRRGTRYDQVFEIWVVVDNG